MHAFPVTRKLLSISVLLAALLPLQAYAFADDDARRAILDLRQQLRQMTEQNQQARLLLARQIEGLQHEVAGLRGEVERLRWESDAKQRMTQEEIGVSTTVNNPQEQAAFNQAMLHFRGGRYPEADTAFATFLAQYPNSQLASEALYFRGNSQYANREFSASTQTLQSLIQGRPNDALTPDAMLIVAANQVGQNNMAGALATLRTIISNYPESTAAQTAQERIQLLQ